MPVRKANFKLKTPLDAQQDNDIATITARLNGVESKVGSKADNSYAQGLLDAKMVKASFDSAIAAKMSQTTFTDSLALKQGASAFNTSIALKQGAAEFTSAAAAKLAKSDFDARVSAEKEWTTAFKDAIFIEGDVPDQEFDYVGKGLVDELFMVSLSNIRRVGDTYHPYYLTVQKTSLWDSFEYKNNQDMVNVIKSDGSFVGRLRLTTNLDNTSISVINSGNTAFRIYMDPLQPVPLGEELYLQSFVQIQQSNYTWLEKNVKLSGPFTLPA